ncbi:glycosyltransferase family 4 protein [Azotobacter beijerinckii]|uniref:Glycosyltransferase involved in cell wall bisynthesis n=1 Tax=Azotobacter beijerinckii TaxID=170623 RepID=A0A1I4AAG5_9GAMM|nr:glycosyltransferase family 4 protein [Azotobacter beijerinckii]SFA92401.1 Glycosyltransferase involved in cell wall bisynthesis [Azotobacter beijerinckii]SFK53388.1 Glycosyltransferase involved in cell wall bisynthesis [Azotobacter beijerinckii]
MDSTLGRRLSASQEKTPLRVAHLLSSGGFYGLERMLLEHCLYAPGEHRVLLLDGPESLARRFREAGVELTRCTGLGSLLRQMGPPDERPTLLNGHGFKGLLYGWLSARCLGLPLVATQHGFTPRSRKQRFYAWLSLRLCRTPQVRAVACVADSIARLHRAAGVGAGKLHVLPNGLPPAPEVVYLRPPTAPAAPLIGFVGRLSAEKGPDLFVELAIALCHRDPRLHAVLLGEGPLRDPLQQSIDAAGLHGRIALPGYRTDLPAWLHALDVLVISSRSEGTPMVLLEAMQAGVPVAAFAVGGIPDVLEHEASGLLSPPGDLAGLTAQVGRLLLDKPLRQRLTDQARLAQLRHYHLPDQAEHWRQLYCNAVGG